MSSYNVAVLRGGPSEEYEVSMKTGASVLQALSNKVYTKKDIVISRSGEWLVDGFARNPVAALEGVDVVFLALHGAYGEDGTVQRQLEQLSIPYTGSGPYSSNLALNKYLTKEFLRQHHIEMPQSFRVTNQSTDISRIAHTISELFGPEYVVKPVSSGSSLDVRMIHGTTELVQTLKEMLAHRAEVLVEERIRGREATVGVVERFRDKSLYTLPAIEIVPPNAATFFDYDHKYNGLTEEICPSRFNKDIKSKLETVAADVHRLLNLSQYSRSDFMIREAPGKPPEVYFLEVNTLPGLTEQSLFPKALLAVGHSYVDFVDFLLKDALAKKQ